MSNLLLQAQSALAGYDREFDDVTLTEITNHALVSLAIPNSGTENLSEAVNKSYGIQLPAVMQSTKSKVDNTQLLGMQIDQYFLMFDYMGDRAVELVAQRLGKTAYLSDQSDSWVFLRISGTKSRQALERICPIDLCPDTFSEGTVARTAMEHLAVIILHESKDCFLLLSPRSSAQSFLHAVETSIHNIS